MGVGGVGDDEKADFLAISTLEKFGVDTIGFERLKGVPTSSTILNAKTQRRKACFTSECLRLFSSPEKEKVDIYDYASFSPWQY